MEYAMYPVDPLSGFIIDSGGNRVNIVDLLGGGAALGYTVEPKQYPAYPLCVVAADGSVVNLADLLKNSARAMNEFPEADEGNLGWIVQYSGETTADLTHGYFYECVKVGNVYSWTPIDFGETPVAAWSNDNLVIT